MANRKRAKGQTMIYKTLHRKQNIEQHKYHKKRRFSGNGSRFCYTSGTLRVTCVTNPFNQDMVTTLKRSRDDFNLTTKNPWLNCFLVSSNHYQANYQRSQKFWNIVSTEIYILIMRCCWNIGTYKWKVHNWKIKIISFVLKCGIYLHRSNRKEYLSF